MILSGSTLSSFGVCCRWVIDVGFAILFNRLVFGLQWQNSHEIKNNQVNGEKLFLVRFRICDKKT